MVINSFVGIRNCRIPLLVSSLMRVCIKNTEFLRKKTKKTEVDGKKEREKKGGGGNGKKERKKKGVGHCLWVRGCSKEEVLLQRKLSYSIFLQIFK